MYGAIIGDLAGSIYEYDQTKEIKSVSTKKLIDSRSFYSDDTILTIAILDAIINQKDYEKTIREYIERYKDYKPDFQPYFKSGFSPRLLKWSEGNIEGISKGNGALMRISPVGYMFDSEIEVRENAREATIPTHNSEEAIDAATTVALMIYYFRKGYSKSEVSKILSISPSYHAFSKLNKSCSETLPNCIYAIAHSFSFNEAIERTLWMGGDTDTNCAIVGSIAEAIYGVDQSLIEQANQKIPDEFVKVLRKSGIYQ